MSAEDVATDVKSDTPDRHSLALAQLVPAPYNPRRISKQALEGLQHSLSEFGDISGIVWNRRTGHLVAGHQRLEALKREHGDALHMEDHALVTGTGERFPVREVDWDTERERLANLAANSILLTGRFTAAAAGLIRALEPVCFPEIKALRLDTLLRKLPLLPVTDEELADAKAERDAACRTAPGDLWILGNHRLLCGDSTKPEDVTRLVGEERAQVCLTDPPYSVGYETINRAVGRRSPAELGQACREPPVEQVLAFVPLIPSNVLVMTYVWNQHLQEFAAAFRDWDLLYECIWFKTDSFVFSQGSRYQMQHEPILVLRRKDAKDKGIWRQPANRSSVFSYPRGHGEHCTTRPFPMWCELMEYHSEPGGAVYEPFCGGGVTVLAAEKLGRRCYAMEIQPQYCDLTLNRWEAATGQKAVRA